MEHYPKVLYQFKDCAGQTWMPSNGTEGMYFEEAFCSKCIHEKFMHTQDHADKQCEVLNQALLNAPLPIKEWVYSDEGWPICTEWKKWDWDKDDDDDSWNDPPVNDPVDPMQLNLFPLSPDEMDFIETNKNKEVENEKIKFSICIL